MIQKLNLSHDDGSYDECDVDESWPYHVFKKEIRDMLSSTDRWLHDDHFFFGEWKRQGCFSRGCKLCESDPPDSDGDGWT